MTIASRVVPGPVFAKASSKETAVTRTILAVAVVGLAVGLAGCGPAPIVDFSTPHVNMHVEGDKIVKVEPVRGDIRIEQLSPKLVRVDGTGVVRVIMDADEIDTHTVDVDKNKIRVHGVDVENKGGTREVFVESKKPIGGVHLDKVKK